MSEYFSGPKFLGRVTVELDLSNYATKADLKNATAVDTSKFTKKLYLADLKSDVDKLDIDKLKNVPTNLSNLKSKADKLDVDKLVPVPIDFSKLSVIVKNRAVKKAEYCKLVKNVNAIQTTDISNLVKKTVFDTKTSETEKKH